MNVKTLWLPAVFAVFLVGCANPKPAKPDPKFDEWLRRSKDLFDRQLKEDLALMDKHIAEEKILLDAIDASKADPARKLELERARDGLVTNHAIQREELRHKHELESIRMDAQMPQ